MSDLSDDHRPSPDALLEQAVREARGRLKIFLGAAPGVGKTYEMLTAGRARLRDRVDVVIGVVETHGRAETRALIRGLEVIPRRSIDYRGQVLDEMDFEAIIERRPDLVLVDELAHTNAPGSRHPKRYLDVLELLERGIDVYTTLNIQHVESLNDVVAQITRIRVRETVPDSLIDRADDIEIIDLTPDDLIKRLHEGKVYLPKTASRAIRNYFSPGNLTALRELALRRTAQRVDQQLLNHMQANAIQGPWPSGERVLVCVRPGTRGASLVRYAKRQADRMRAPWAALHVETVQTANASDEEKNQVAATLRLAEQLGAEIVTLPGQNIANEVLRYAGTHNYSHIIIGRSNRPKWREWLTGSVAFELIRNSGDISVHVISGREPDSAPERGVTTQDDAPSLRPFIAALAWVSVATLIGQLLARTLDVQNIALVFLMAVLTSAATVGLWPALLSSVMGALAFNFFFLDPTYTFTIRDPEGVLALMFFLGAAVITSNLTARVQRQAHAAQNRARTTERLYMFSKRLSVAATLDDVLWVIVNQMATMLGVNAVILLPEGSSVSVRAGFPPDDTLDDGDIAAAHWAWEHNRPAGRGAETLPGARRLYLPLRTGRVTVGVVGLDSDKAGPLLSPTTQRLFEALADQAALAIERIMLVDDLDRARLAAEADRLRSALLTSVSHDLRTPLAGIVGAASTLREYYDQVSADQRTDLLQTVQTESDRLGRYIGNLLDMTRIESGLTEPNSTLVDLDEIVGATVERARKILKNHTLTLKIEQDLPMLRLDPVLTEQVLFNLIDNARKYSPEGSTIKIEAWRERKWILLHVLDEGPGIPEADTDRIFDMFYRVKKGDHVQAGTGLGLSICRGFIEAMGGSITAENLKQGRGAKFTIRLPALPEPDEVTEAV